MPVIAVKKKKTLVLSNILSVIIDWDSRQSVETIVEQMQSYIRVRGNEQIGPLIQYTDTVNGKDGTPDVIVVLMLQCRDFLTSAERPYRMIAKKKIENCLYTRYVGKEEALSIAYDKLRVEAYECDLKLKGDSYTVFVDRDEDHDTVTVDLFMECV